MAHPPSRTSNLTPDIFFDIVFGCQDKTPYIKLDFKRNRHGAKHTWLFNGFVFEALYG